MMVHCITLLHDLMQLQLHESELERPVPFTQKNGAFGHTLGISGVWFICAAAFFQKAELQELFTKYIP